MHILLRSLVVIVFAGLPSRGEAFELKMDTNGNPLHWEPGDVVVSLRLAPDPTGTVVVPAGDVAAGSAVRTWANALEGTEVGFVAGDGTEVPVPGDGPDGINEVRWALDLADPELEIGTLARTFVSYRTDNGVILDADVVLNAAQFKWAAPPSVSCTSTYDVQNTVAHELGHVLGLAESVGQPDATMYPTSPPCEVSKRNLANDDRDGIAAIYPQASNDTDTAETGSTAPISCSTAPGGPGALSLALAALALHAMRARRRWPMALAAMLVATPAGAAELRRLDPSELSAHADLVVRGTVLDVQTPPDGDIATDARIEVAWCARAACPADVRVRSLGGERDGLGLWVDGEARFEVGEEVLVYLRHDASGRLRVVGGLQGALHIEDDRAVRDLRGHGVLNLGTWAAGDLEVFDLEALERSLRDEP